MSIAIQNTQQALDSQNKKKVVRRRLNKTVAKKRPIEIVHIELFYADGSTGEMNVTSQGGNVELQYVHLRRYLVELAEVSGLVKFHAHYAWCKDGKNIKKLWSWFLFDCLTGTEIDPQAKLLI